MSTALHLVADRPAKLLTPDGSRARRWRLLLSASCAAHAALAVRTVVQSHSVELVDLQSHIDPATGWHYCRCELDDAGAAVAAHDLRRTLLPMAVRAPLHVHVAAAHERKRVVVLVSKADHCLRDLFLRQRDGDLEVDIACVISNHEDLGPLALSRGVPFHHVPMPASDPSGTARAAAFERVFELFDRYRGDVMVLARFMQVLPPDFCAGTAGRILNVHHSLLPSFSGARPYHQAWQHGVKWIGSTCHYVTAELDQGPIIEQDALRVDHAHSVDDLILAGRELECRVLGSGLRAHVEDRIIVWGRRTVIFNR